jgi:hypothetical protein
MRRLLFVLAAAAPFFAPGPAAAISVPASVHFPPGRPVARTPAAEPGRKIGLANILTTKDGGQIYGFDINQNGDDGVLASAQTVSGNGATLVSVETFNQNSGKISKSFAKYLGLKNSYGVDGIFAGDVALITHFIEPKGSIYAIRKYDVMNPVTAEEFTGQWTSPVRDINVESYAENQVTTNALLFAIELKKQDAPILISSNIAASTSKVYKLDPNLFGLADGPQIGQYTAANQAVFALSPDAGAVGGSPPLNIILDLTTGKSTQFAGYNNGYYHAGGVNGLAVDPATGVAATTTELNAQVEFYNLNNQTGIAAVQLPCTGDTDQLSSGSGIAVDQVNHLFLVTETYYCTGSQGSAIVVYDESGNLVEAITGFNFAIAEPAPAINPSKRMGWAFGPSFSQLQQFYY